MGRGVQAATSWRSGPRGWRPGVLLVLLCAYRSPPPSYHPWALRGRLSASHLHGSTLMPTADQQGESTFSCTEGQAPRCQRAWSLRSGAVGGGGGSLGSSCVHQTGVQMRQLRELVSRGPRGASAFQGPQRAGDPRRQEPGAGGQEATMRAELRK